MEYTEKEVIYYLNLRMQKIWHKNSMTKSFFGSAKNRFTISAFFADFCFYAILLGFSNLQHSSGAVARAGQMLSSREPTEH